MNGINVHARHCQVLDSTGNFHSRIFGIDTDFTDVAGHIVKPGLESFQVSIGHFQNGVRRLHDIGVFNGFCQFRTHKAVAHVGIEHRSERQVPQRGCMGVLDTVDGGATLAAVQRSGGRVFALHQPHRLHGVALFLPSCILFRFLLCRSLSPQAGIFRLSPGCCFLARRVFRLTPQPFRFPCCVLALQLLLLLRIKTCLATLLRLKILFVLDQFLTVELLLGVQPLHESLLRLFGQRESRWSIWNRHTRSQRNAGTSQSPLNIQGDRGSAPDLSQ